MSEITKEEREAEVVLNLLNAMKDDYKPVIGVRSGQDLNEVYRDVLDYAIAAIREREVKSGVKEKIVEILMKEFRSVYCDTCAYNADDDRNCWECHRKAMNWAISESCAEKLAEAILKEMPERKEGGNE